MCCENYLRKVCFFTAIWHSYKTLISKKTTAFTVARFRENWPTWLVNNFSQKSTALTAAECFENYLRKVCFSRQNYKTLISKKKPPHSRQQGAVRIGPTDKSIILEKKSTALTAAVCHENYLKEVFFFKAIRHSYKTLVSKKKNTALTTARCREN